MDEAFNIKTPTEKIYKDKAIYAGTFLGGPLVAGYFIAENFKVFGERDRARKTWLYTIIATIIIFAGIFLIPHHFKIPNQIIPLIYTGIAYYLVKHFQGQNIEEHINSGGELFSWWRTIGVALIGLVVILASVFVIVFLTDSTTIAESTKNYGVMKHEISFDKNNISETEVNKIADGLTKTTFFDEAVTKYVYARKVNDKYELSFSVFDGIANDNQALQPFIDLRTDLQTLFPNNKIIFKLVVDNLDNVVKRVE